MPMIKLNPNASGPAGSVRMLLLAVLTGCASVGSASACSACFGKSDSPLAQGMNWGIFSLLAVIIPVLGCVGGFFVYLAKKSAAVHAVTASAAHQGNDAAQQSSPRNPNDTAGG